MPELVPTHCGVSLQPDSIDELSSRFANPYSRISLRDFYPQQSSLINAIYTIRSNYSSYSESSYLHSQSFNARDWVSSHHSIFAALTSHKTSNIKT